MEEEIVGTREAPALRGRGSQPELREEQAGPPGVADRLVLLIKPGNASGGKEPDSNRKPPALLVRIHKAPPFPACPGNG